MRLVCETCVRDLCERPVRGLFVRLVRDLFVRLVCSTCLFDLQNLPALPARRSGNPRKTSAYVAMTVTIFVDPMRIKLEATEKMTPARNVST